MILFFSSSPCFPVAFLLLYMLECKRPFPHFAFLYFICYLFFFFFLFFEMLVWAVYWDLSHKRNYMLLGITSSAQDSTQKMNITNLRKQWVLTKPRRFFLSQKLVFWKVRNKSFFFFFCEMLIRAFYIIRKFWTHAPHYPRTPPNHLG